MKLATTVELPPDFERLAAGGLTWLLFLLIPWLGGASMASLLVFPLLPFVLGTIVFYVVLSTREIRGFRRAVAAFLLVTGLLSVEWAAVQTASREGGEILAASRPSATVDYRVSVRPMPWAIGGVLLLFAGMNASGRGRHRAWTISETAAFGLVCPAVSYLVRLNILALSA